MYKFKGYDWIELAECWGITVDKKPFMVQDEGEEEQKVLFERPETIDIEININNTKMIVTTEDEEEVLAEKIKRHIMNNIDGPTGNFKDPQMREDIINFLEALCKESKEIDYNYPVYEGMMKIEDDVTLAQWIVISLERLWT